MNDIAHDIQTAAGQRHPEGHTPPLETLGLAKSLLAAHHAAESARRYQRYLDDARLQEQARRLALAHVRADSPEFQHLQKERRRALEERIARSKCNHERHAGAPARTSLTIETRPYDFDWVSGSGQGIEHANRSAGTYDLAVQSIGSGNRNIAAGIGFWFYSGDGNPRQRFAALLDYFDDWWDSAEFYVANNNSHTRLWVFGAAENAWVAQSDGTPSWSDSVGWLESHGNDPEGESGRVVGETYFNARPGSWYQCWIWTQAHVYGDSGWFGFGASSIHMNVTVPFAVMGSL
jgi:hypothetical protein